MKIRRIGQLTVVLSLLGSVGCCAFWEKHCAPAAPPQGYYCPCAPAASAYPVAAPVAVPAAGWAQPACACPPGR